MRFDPPCQLHPRAATAATATGLDTDAKFDLGSWVTVLLAESGRKKLTAAILGTEQERALRSAATAAVQSTTRELNPNELAGDG